MLNIDAYKRLDALFAQIHAHWTLTIWIAIGYAGGIHRLQKWVVGLLITGTRSITRVTSCYKRTRKRGISCRYMAKRSAFELKWPLVCWNTALAVFSLLGFIRMSEEFSHVVRNYPLLDSISYPGDPREPAGFWCFAFAISKVLELFDTVFIVLRKKKLIFLHWYHHAVVVVMVWHTLKEAAGSGRWFILMNYGEHALMYGYYALAAAGLGMPRAVSMVLTTLQTVQMFTGVAISFIVLYWKLQGRIMQQSYENLFLCFSVYVSFAVLFCNFFNKSYIEEKEQKTKAANGTYPAVAEICGEAYYVIPNKYASLVGPERWWHTVDVEALLAALNTPWTHTIWVAIIYALITHMLQKHMETRPAFELKWPLIVWNSLLAVFSILGFIRLSEEFSHVIRNYPLLDSISYGGEPNGPMGFWCMCFGVSKFFELFDTTFVLLRKKKLIFLHWYHHAVVLVVVLHSLKEAAGSGRWFILMNYGVHSLMYSYYALAAAGVRMPRAVSMVITTLQTTQMFTGVAISFIVFYWKLQGRYMQQSFENLFLCFAVYVSFAVLFSDFFSKAYLDKAPKAKAA
ncbi:hypothetical protein PRIPAC_96325 [Pristionchus pacificus]|uniref:Elongation of very long chain fatty acids protein n=1 Tax=Pristionchus pacificus TaxID=54126 RepID=A0A2A6B328_PRIPA|nr:hypothetical protein PRIPAC_96325 [Pristionchus pacificus]|eukprot:PDM60268.1 hypothetical protein PRIPAC_54093 [Pristionchus pacificus]